MKTLKELWLKLKEEEIKYPIITYDENWNILTYEDSNGYSYKYTYDENWKILTYKNSDGNFRKVIKEWTLSYYKDEDRYYLNWKNVEKI